MRRVVAFITGLPIFAGPAVMLWELYNWLETGAWAPIRLGKFLDHWVIARPFTPFVDINRFIDWAPLTLGVFVASIPFVYLGFYLLRLYDLLTRRNPDRLPERGPLH